jgi:hypothetical protein
MKEGDRVVIRGGVYQGQKATVRLVMFNGCIVERDSTDEERFCPVKFENLDFLEELADLTNNRDE